MISLSANVPRWPHLSTRAELPASIAEQLAAALHTSPSAAVAIVGAEPELFGRPIARRLGSRGVAYSIELAGEFAPVSAQRLLFGHVKIKHRDDDALPLADASLDLVLWAFAFRTLEHVSRMLAETKRVLRPGGRFAVADWVRGDGPGVGRDDRTSTEVCERCFTAGGFSILGNRMLNASHYLIVGRRQSGGGLSTLDHRLLTVS